MTSLHDQDKSFRIAEDAILDAIDTPIPTKELVSKVLQKIDDEYSIRAAIWFLIGRGEIEIQRDKNTVLLAKV